MKPKIIRTAGQAALLLGAGMLLTFTCTVATPSARAVSVTVNVGNDDDYVYYPEYEMYYSQNHHVYVYREGNVWVRRPAPPRAWAHAVVSAPFVHVGFHDSPEHHHKEIIHSYPKNWRPHGNDHRDDHDHHGDDHHDDHDHH